MKKFPHYHQLEQMDCGPTCLRMVAKHFGRHYSAQTMRERAQIGKDGVSMLGIAEAAEAVGFKTVGVRVTLDKLVEDTPLPCILHWGQNHFVVLHKVEKDSVSRRLLQGIMGGRSGTGGPRPGGPPVIGHIATDQAQSNHLRDTNPPETHPPKADPTSSTALFHIADPASTLVTYTAEEFERRWLSAEHEGEKKGLALLLEPGTRFYEEGEKVEGLRLGQLIGYLLRYRSLVVQLGLGMLAASGLSLLLPFLTQAVVDVGIGTQNLSFVYLVLVAQLVLTLSSSAVGFLQGWILLHISVRLNLTILSEFLAKLMRLPLSFFDVRQFGDIMQRIGDHQRIEAHVRQKLEADYSPEQIVGDAARKGIECVSHERIYQLVWDDKKQGGRLYRHMRTKGKRYAKRGSEKGKRGQIVGKVDIDQRPDIVEENQRVGDLEMDLVIGRGHSGVLLTINDRATGMLKMGILPSKAAALVQAKAVELLADWKALLHTVTTDNGKEFAHHQKLAEELCVDCYFAKPYHSWERAGRPVPS
jgi:hypothetical protein